MGRSENQWNINGGKLSKQRKWSRNENMRRRKNMKHHEKQKQKMWSCEISMKMKKQKMKAENINENEKKYNENKKICMKANIIWKKYPWMAKWQARKEENQAEN